MSLPSGDGYILTDKKMIKTLEDIINTFENYKIIGGIAILIYSYLYGDDYYKYRSTVDIDLAINPEYEINNISKLYKNLPGADIRKGKIFGYNGIEIKDKDIVAISILFKDDTPYNTLEIKINNKKLRLNVAKLEYLLIDKIFTYLKRKEQKDIRDIEEISKILDKNEYDKNLINSIFSKYSNKYKKYSDEAKKLLEEYLYHNSMEIKSE